MTPEQLAADNERLRKALVTCKFHSLLEIRRAAFAPTIGVRYSEAIRAAIATECARLEQFVDWVLDTAEPVAAEAGRPIPEPDRDDTHTVTHD